MPRDLKNNDKPRLLRYSPGRLSEKEFDQMVWALDVSDLRKGFRTRTGRVEAVRGISFAVPPGEVLAFLGPNGAGKTTTIKMVAGLVRPDHGRVVVEGRPLAIAHDWATARIGAVLEGSRNLYWRLTALENLLYWGSVRRVPPRKARVRAAELLERVGLADRAHNTVQTLSRGMQQKLALCQALMHRPSVLLLDEPTLGLDFESSEGIKRMVRELAAEGVAILLTTHQLDVAQELSDRVAIVRDGRLVLEGDTDAILKRFSKPVATVEAALPWPADIAGRLGDLPITIAGPHHLRVPLDGGDATVLYQVLERLAPHPLVRVERHQADLSEVFRVVTAVKDA
jgi:ABC-2 type transport system ATP-binding protein